MIWPFARHKLCPFCQPPHPLIKHADDRWQCPDCQTLFDGNLDPRDENQPPHSPPPPAFLSTSSSSRRTCQELRQGRLVADYDILCRNCQHQQTLLVQLLAANEGADEGYREELEQRYPLCAPCQRAVYDRLAQIDYRLRIKSLGGLSRSKRAVLVAEEGEASRRLFWCRLVSLVVNLLAQAYLLHSVQVKIWIRLSLAVVSVLPCMGWRHLPLAMALVVGRLLPLLDPSWHPLLSQSSLWPGWIKQWSDWMGLAFLLIWLPLHFNLPVPAPSPRHERRPQTVSQSAPQGRRADDLLSSLSALSTSTTPPSGKSSRPSLPSSIHHRPFTTLIKPEPVKIAPAKFSFSPSLNHHQHQTAPANPFASTHLQPARLAFEKSSGLEAPLLSFNLSDRSFSQAADQGWQVGLSVCLLLGRYAVRAHPPLITLLLAACFCWRGFLWDRLRSQSQVARILDGLIGARLFWLTLQLVNKVQVGGLLDEWAALATDYLIILAR